MMLTSWMSGGVRRKAGGASTWAWTATCLPTGSRQSLFFRNLKGVDAGAELEVEVDMDRDVSANLAHGKQCPLVPKGVLSATGREVEVDMDRDVLTDLASGKEYPLKPLGEVCIAHAPDCGMKSFSGFCNVQGSWNEGPCFLIMLLSEVLATPRSPV